jgi:hypothetical protein
MKKVPLNVVAVCASAVVEIQRFTQLVTESYMPHIQMQQQNGCTVTKIFFQEN